MVEEGTGQTCDSEVTIVTVEQTVSVVLLLGRGFTG